MYVDELWRRTLGIRTAERCLQGAVMLGPAKALAMGFVEKVATASVASQNTYTWWQTSHGTLTFEGSSICCIVAGRGANAKFCTVRD
jgi:hypothetical protein